MKVEFVLEKDESSGGWAVSSPQCKGLFTEGETIQGALEMLVDAYRCWGSQPEPSLAE